MKKKQIQNKIKLAGKKALKEAKERRKKTYVRKLPKEINGYGNIEPTRFGDWEKKGITSDF